MSLMDRFIHFDPCFDHLTYIFELFCNVISLELKALLSLKCYETNLQACPDTSLEEFLEELDALCDPEVDGNPPDTETRDGLQMDASADMKAESPLNPTDSANPEPTSSKSTEKKVRFTEDLIQVAREKDSNTGTIETKASLLKNTLQAKTASEDSIKNTQEQEGTGTLPTDNQSKSAGQEDVLETSVKEPSEPPEDFSKEEPESGHIDTSCYSLSSQNGSDASDCTEQDHLYPVEHMKSSTSRSTGRRACDGYLKCLHP